MSKRLVLVTGALAGRRCPDGFLASDAARFITSQIVSVNGGKTAA
jgi:hypothetical protein